MIAIPFLIGLLVGGLIAWQSIRSAIRNGPLGDITKKAIRIERARGSLRGRMHACNVVQDRAVALFAAGHHEVALELMELASKIVLERPLIEDVENAPDDIDEMPILLPKVPK